MITFGVKSDLDKVAAGFDAMAQKQVPFATSLALNRTAVVARDAIKADMAKDFDRPTPYTLNSLFVKNSTKANLVARVGHKEFAGKGVPASKFLRPEIEGGARRKKRSEILLGYYYTPSDHVQLDQYGNVPGSLITKILSTVKAFGEQGYRANITDRSKKRQIKKGTFADYYIVRPGNRRGIKPGVYMRKETSAGRSTHIPILFFTSTAPTYKPRYPLEAIVQRVIQSEFGKQFAAAMDYALATARIKVR